MDISDGEIKDDFSDISEEEYFDNIANKIEKRKLELELLNQIEAYDDYAKENRYENYRNRQQNNIASRTSSRSAANIRIEKPRKSSETRNRSYRATSVFSTSLAPKRKRQRKRRKYSKSTLPVLQKFIFSSSEEESIIINDQSDDEDDELLQLRLQALTSKQEVKELIEPCLGIENTKQEPVVIDPPPNNEEEQLRIAALRSAILKKKDHFQKRKQMRKLENERPYSPTDNFEPIVDVAMDLSNSPLGSPFHDTLCDINEEVDMEISTSSPPEISNNNEDKSSDMEIVCSPQSKEIANDDEEEDDENELRSMLLSSISKKKMDDENDSGKEKASDDTTNSQPPSPAPITITNLKLAVERLKKQKQETKVCQKSGTKTIKMILEEQKNKKKCKSPAQEVPEPVEQSLKSSSDHQVATEEQTVPNENVNEQEEEETDLIDKISNDPSLQSNIDNSSSTDNRIIELPDSSFSTITDTKNIPLLPDTKKPDNRLVTSLESIKPVSPLIISLRVDSSDDEYDLRAKQAAAAKKKTTDLKSNNDFEKNLEHFLKNIRTQQEKTQVTKTPPSKSKSSNVSPKTASAVKHLPLSSQVEYEKLVQKMKILQEAKLQREKSGTLKRTKSTSSNTDKSSNPSQNSIPPETTKTDANKAKNTPPNNKNKAEISAVNASNSKINDALGKIPLLDKNARVRLIAKTENNFLNHSKNLLDSTEANIKILNENGLEFKRREKIEAKIVEYEKTLAKYKNYLRFVNTRIKTNTPKLLESQRDLIKLRNHQYKFGMICKKVGETVRGESYRLPEYENGTIEKNLLKISEKTDEIHKNLSDQPFASRQFKFIAEKVKEFVPKPASPAKDVEENSTTQKAIETSDENKEVKNQECRIVRSVSQLIAFCNENGNDEDEKEVESEQMNEEIKIPEINRHVKRIMECSAPSSKKMKLYESPLEFLKYPSSIQNRKNLNQIVCPFAMEGTCKDTKCKYLHL